MDRKLSFAWCSAALVALSLCLACGNATDDQQNKPQRTVDLRPASEDAVRAAATQLNQAFVTKDVNKIVSLYADDASLFQQGSAIDSGKEAIHSAWVALATAPGFSFNTTTTKVEAAQSGDMAYETGIYLSTIKEKGELKAQKGKYVVVWKKLADGNWKIVAHIFNTDE